MSSIQPVSPHPTVSSGDPLASEQLDDTQLQQIADLFAAMRDNPEEFARLGWLEINGSSSHQEAVSANPPSPLSPEEPKRVLETSSDSEQDVPLERPRKRLTKRVEASDEEAPENNSPEPLQSNKSYSTRKHWTPDEVKLALKYQHLYPNHWKMIAQHIPNRTAKAVQQFFISRPQLLEKAKHFDEWNDTTDDTQTIPKRSWTHEENCKLMGLFKKEKDIHKAAVAFKKEGTRSLPSIKAHLLKLTSVKQVTPSKLHTAHDATPWTFEEDQRLVELIEAYKVTSGKVGKEFFNQAVISMGRTEPSIRGRYYNHLLKRGHIGTA